MTIIGIDPGLSGGIVVLQDGEIAQAVVMPTTKRTRGREIDEQELRRLIVRESGALPRIYLERIHAAPVQGRKQGVASMFSFGAGWGLVRGILCGLCIPYHLVRPQQWQRVTMAGEPKGSEYLIVSRRWPGVDWRASERCRVPHGGIVDAALIALYGHLREGG